MALGSRHGPNQARKLPITRCTLPVANRSLVHLVVLVLSIFLPVTTGRHRCFLERERERQRERETERERDRERESERKCQHHQNSERPLNLELAFNIDLAPYTAHSNPPDQLKSSLTSSMSHVVACFTLFLSSCNSDEKFTASVRVVFSQSARLYDRRNNNEN